MSASRPTIAVLATMNTKSKEAHFVADVLTRAGATPWIVDLSMKAHAASVADVTGAQVAAAAGASWQAVDERSRQDAAAVMIEGGTRISAREICQGRSRGRHRHRRRERHRSRVLDSAGAALPRAQGHGQRGRRHRSRAVVCRGERHLHVSLDWRCLAQPRDQGGHGERGERGGDGSQNLGGETGGADRSMRRLWRSPRSAARRRASIA